MEGIFGLSHPRPSSFPINVIPTALGQNCLTFLLGKLAGANACLVKLSNGVFGLEKNLLQRRFHAPSLESRAKAPS